MDSLIPIINSLQDVFSTVQASPVNLPQIIVVGSQSAGKSSVLENIVGQDFLPRGTGICTRRPLVLQLIHKDDDPEEKQAYAIFAHDKKTRYYDFDKVRQEIEDDTNRISGINKGISTKAISLRIFSPEVVNLTLVDLPGLTKVPVGDQPPDIEVLIREMITTYITNPNAIILAVTPANTDIANSEALKMAKDVDPEGLRTIGVLTKLDLMDRGTNCLDVLKGKIVPLRLGFIGVINRSQEDIDRCKPIQDALSNERLFLKKHPAYRGMADRMGTKYLTETLNRILINHIHASLPELKATIQQEIATNERMLLQYGKSPMNPDVSRNAYLLDIIARFSSAYSQSIEGRSNHETYAGGLFGGARISYIFHHTFKEALDRIDPFDNLSDADIRTAIYNSSGPCPSLFVSETSFELLVKSQIVRLEDSCLTCLDYVYRELQSIADQQISMAEIARFKHLRESISQSTNELLSTCMDPARQMIQSLIQIELAYINTNHPDFINGSRAVSETLDTMKYSKRDSEERKSKEIPHDLRDAPPTEREQIETDLIKSLIVSYFQITRKNIEDSVPKAIMYFLVNRSKNVLQSELVQSLYKDELLETLLEEDHEVASQRRGCAETLKILRRAIEIVNEIRDIRL